MENCNYQSLHRRFFETVPVGDTTTYTVNHQQEVAYGLSIFLSKSMTLYDIELPLHAVCRNVVFIRSQLRRMDCSLDPFYQP